MSKKIDKHLKNIAESIENLNYEGILKTHGYENPEKLKHFKIEIEFDSGKITMEQDDFKEVTVQVN